MIVFKSHQKLIGYIKIQNKKRKKRVAKKSDEVSWIISFTKQKGRKDSLICFNVFYYVDGQTHTHMVCFHVLYFAFLHFQKSLGMIYMLYSSWGPKNK